MKAMEVRREYRFDSAAIMRQVLRTALVRIKEREAASPANPRAASQEKRPELPRNGQALAGASDSVGQRLREAEEKRIEAERRAAEAERKLREAEEAQARVTESFNLSQLEDDVLGLLTSTPLHSAESPQTETATAASPVTAGHSDHEIDIGSIFDDAVARAGSDASSDAVVSTEAVVETVDSASFPVNEGKVHPEASEPSPALEPTISANFSTAAEPSFESEAMTSNSSFPFGLPVIAVAAGLLVVVAVGGWLMFGSGSTSDAAATIQAQPAVSQEKPAEPPVQNAYQPDDSSQVPAGDPTAADPGTNDQQALTQPEKTAPVKAKKATPAKTPAPKKAVTVDDLINDN
jgi:hypothetical protein